MLSTDFRQYYQCIVSFIVLLYLNSTEKFSDSEKVSEKLIEGLSVLHYNFGTILHL